MSEEVAVRRVVTQISELVGGDDREPLVERVRGWVQAAGIEADERRRSHAIIAEQRDALLDAAFYLDALGSRLAALDLDNTETYGCLKTATLMARQVRAAIPIVTTPEASVDRPE